MHEREQVEVLKEVGYLDLSLFKGMSECEVDVLKRTKQKHIPTGGDEMGTIGTAEERETEGD